MNNAQIDWSKMVTAADKAKELRVAKASAVKTEATKRIESRWDNAGQNNVALNLYSESERLDCINWINAHRAACQAIIERPDLLDLDITDNSLWPTES
jgi:transposase